jgi:hypothetical protein
VDPQDLTSMSRPPERHRTERPELEHQSADPSGATEQPDPATHEEHLRSSGRLATRAHSRTGASTPGATRPGGPS